MPQIEIRVQRVEPLYDMYAEPAVKFVGDITNRAGDIVFLVSLQCDIRSKDKGITIGRVPLTMGNLRQNLTTNFEVVFSFSIDSSNAVHDLLKQQELEDVIFELIFHGFWLVCH